MLRVRTLPAAPALARVSVCGLRTLGTFGTLGALHHVITRSSSDDRSGFGHHQRESRKVARGVRQKMILPWRVERRRDARLGRSFSNSSFGSHCSRRHRPPTPFSSSSPLTASSPTRAPRAHPLKKRGAVGYPPTDIFDRRSRRLRQPGRFFQPPPPRRPRSSLRARCS